MIQYTGSRVAFSLFGIDVYWYGILIVTGMVLAVYLSSNELKRLGHNPDVIYDVAIWILPIAIVGARLYYVIFEWGQFQGDIVKIVSVRDGGLAIHGGVIAGVITGYIYCRKKGYNFLYLADIIMIFLPLAQAIGRWGNFVNNEAHGGPTDLPWGILIDGVKYHPTFLYESICNFLLALSLWYIFRKKNPVTGTTTSLYLIVYGIVRFFIEGLRTDSLMIGAFRQAQLFSVASIIFGIFLFVWSRKNNKKLSESKFLQK